MQVVLADQRGGTVSYERPRGLGATRFLGVLVLGLLLWTPLGLAQDQDTKFVRGDVNRDALVSFADIIPIIHATVIPDSDYPPLACYDAADVNDDGHVDIADVFSMLIFLFDPSTTSGLPLPYPNPGTDPTLDFLTCSSTLPQDPNGSDIPFIYFTLGLSGSPGIAVHAGQVAAQLPVYMDSVSPAEGYTISLEFDPALIASVHFEFVGSVAIEHGADLRISAAPGELPGFTHCYVVLELMPPYTELTIPPGEEQLLATLVFDVNPNIDADSIRLCFHDTPAMGEESPVKNEVAQEGGEATPPETFDLEVPVVPEESLFIRGDVSGDRCLDLIDAVNLIDYLFGLESMPPSCPDAADVNDDGELDIVDCIQLLGYLFGDLAPPEAPFPYLGIDPTPDSIPDC